MPLYQTMFRNGLKPGSDLDLLGICAATTTINLYPEPSFYNVFYREVGRQAVSLLRAAVDGHAPGIERCGRGAGEVGRDRQQGVHGATRGWRSQDPQNARTRGGMTWLTR
jgi:hypothetical protein